MPPYIAPLIAPAQTGPAAASPSIPAELAAPIVSALAPAPAPLLGPALLPPTPSDPASLEPASAQSPPSQQPVLAPAPAASPVAPTPSPALAILSPAPQPNNASQPMAPSLAPTPGQVSPASSQSASAPAPPPAADAPSPGSSHSLDTPVPVPSTDELGSGFSQANDAPAPAPSSDQPRSGLVPAATSPAPMPDFSLSSALQPAASPVEVQNIGEPAATDDKLAAPAPAPVHPIGSRSQNLLSPAVAPDSVQPSASTGLSGSILGMASAPTPSQIIQLGLTSAIAPESNKPIASGQAPADPSGPSSQAALPPAIAPNNVQPDEGLARSITVPAPAPSQLNTSSPDAQSGLASAPAPAIKQPGMVSGGSSTGPGPAPMTALADDYQDSLSPALAHAPTTNEPEVAPGPNAVTPGPAPSSTFWDQPTPGPLEMPPALGQQHAGSDANAGPSPASTTGNNHPVMTPAPGPASKYQNAGVNSGSITSNMAPSLSHEPSLQLGPAVVPASFQSDASSSIKLSTPSPMPAFTSEAGSKPSLPPTAAPASLQADAGLSAHPRAPTQPPTTSSPPGTEPAETNAMMASPPSTPAGGKSMPASPPSISQLAASPNISPTSQSLLSFAASIPIGSQLVASPLAPAPVGQAAAPQGSPAKAPAPHGGLGSSISASPSAISDPATDSPAMPVSLSPDVSVPGPSPGIAPSGTQVSGGQPMGPGGYMPPSQEQLHTDLARVPNAPSPGPDHTSGVSGKSLPGVPLLSAPFTPSNAPANVDLHSGKDASTPSAGQVPFNSPFIMAIDSRQGSSNGHAPSPALASGHPSPSQAASPNASLSMSHLPVSMMPLSDGPVVAPRVTRQPSAASPSHASEPASASSSRAISDTAGSPSGLQPRDADGQSISSAPAGQPAPSPINVMEGPHALIMGAPALAPLAADNAAAPQGDSFGLSMMPGGPNAGPVSSEPFVGVPTPMGILSQASSSPVPRGTGQPGREPAPSGPAILNAAPSPSKQALGNPSQPGIQPQAGFQSSAPSSGPDQRSLPIAKPKPPSHGPGPLGALLGGQNSPEAMPGQSMTSRAPAPSKNAGHALSPSHQGSGHTPTASPSTRIGPAFSPNQFLAPALPPVPTPRPTMPSLPSSGPQAYPSPARSPDPMLLSPIPSSSPFPPSSTPASSPATADTSPAASDDAQLEAPPPNLNLADGAGQASSPGVAAPASLITPGASASRLGVPVVTLFLAGLADDILTNQTAQAAVLDALRSSVQAAVGDIPVDITLQQYSAPASNGAPMRQLLTGITQMRLHISLKPQLGHLSDPATSMRSLKQSLDAALGAASARAADGLVISNASVADATRSGASTGLGSAPQLVAVITFPASTAANQGSFESAQQLADNIQTNPAVVLVGPLLEAAQVQVVVLRLDPTSSNAAPDESEAPSAGAVQRAAPPTGTPPPPAPSPTAPL
ncbi:hypothetical protein WJX74_001957 [Apatococcus lobatus]|uniref:Uncharacterized protein n=1 Tax=Apatococcus lobatus TaxID=904363 RepID=A0AAW1S2D3_9CHLO